MADGSAGGLARTSVRCLGLEHGIWAPLHDAHQARVDLVLGPERAPPDHAVEHALPAPAVLAVVPPHAVAVAREAAAEQHFPAGRIGEANGLRLLRLGRAPSSGFPGISQIQVYPSHFKVHRSHHDGSLVTETEDWLAGESWQAGRVILSWPDTVQGAREDRDGYNVVIHEFAHKLDMENGNADGYPVPRNGMRVRCTA